MRPMITNGGSHPPDKWADVTTDTIVDLIQVEDDSNSPEAAAARQAKRGLRDTLFDIFNTSFAAVQKVSRDEVQKIKDTAKAIANAEGPIDVTPHMAVTAKLDAALAATPFAAHFAKPEVKQVLHQIVGQHIANAIDIERKWHKDRLTAGKGN